MTPLVVIEDSTILSMLNDANFVSQIPCLQNKIEIFRQGNAGCGACARKRQQNQRKEMAALKACIGNLSADKKAALKQLLNAQKVRVAFARPDGEIVQLTF